MAYAVGSAPGGGTLMSDGTVFYGSTPFGDSGSTYTNIPGSSQTNVNTGVNPAPTTTSGDLLGASTGGSSGGSGGGGGSTNPETNYVWDPSLGMMVKEADLIKRAQEKENAIRNNINTT